MIKDRASKDKSLGISYVFCRFKPSKDSSLGVSMTVPWKIGPMVKKRDREMKRNIEIRKRTK